MNKEFYTCKKCGGELWIDPETHKVFCPKCIKKEREDKIRHFGAEELRPKSI